MTHPEMLLAFYNKDDGVILGVRHVDHLFATTGTKMKYKIDNIVVRISKYQCYEIAS